MEWMIQERSGLRWGRMEGESTERETGNWGDIEGPCRNLVQGEFP